MVLHPAHKGLGIVVRSLFFTSCVVFLASCVGHENRTVSAPGYPYPYYYGGYPPPGVGSDYYRYRNRYRHRQRQEDRERLREEREELRRDRREFEREKKRFEQEQESSSSVKDRCPPGFSPGGRCTKQERNAGCKDHRTASGIPCIKR
ncbi:MAG: hypothetical protein ACO3XO_10260 [Bdellovibrionota bacterium]